MVVQAIALGRQFLMALPQGRALVAFALDEAGAKLKTLGDLEAVNEKEMAIGTGIDYRGAGVLSDAQSTPSASP